MTDSSDSPWTPTDDLARAAALIGQQEFQAFRRELVEVRDAAARDAASRGLSGGVVLQLLTKSELPVVESYAARLCDRLTSLIVDHDELIPETAGWIRELLVRALQGFLKAEIGNIEAESSKAQLPPDAGASRVKWLERQIGQISSRQAERLELAVVEARLKARKASAVQPSATTSDAALELGKQLGSGGFGTVYLHQHPILRMPFAVKLFDPSAFASAGDHAQERFLKEARLLFQLNHRGIVRVYDVGIANGRPFMKMEYISGANLNAHLERGLSPDRVRGIIRDLAQALAHAHAAGIVHRDIKPSNVMIDEGERTVLVDFGLGVLREDEIARITRTGERAAGGSYTAPELVQDPRLIEPLTDMFSLGALWYQLLDGRPPAGIGVEERLARFESKDGELIRSCLRPLEQRISAQALVDALSIPAAASPADQPAPETGVGTLSSEEDRKIRVEYFRQGYALCPKDEAILRIQETQAFGQKTPDLFVTCPVCGLERQLAGMRA